MSIIYILAVVGSSLDKKDKHFTWYVGNIARAGPAKIQKGVILVWRAKQWQQWEMSFGCSQAGMVLHSRIFSENIVCRHDMDTYMTLKEEFWLPMILWARKIHVWRCNELQDFEQMYVSK